MNNKLLPLLTALLLSIALLGCAPAARSTPPAAAPLLDLPAVTAVIFRSPTCTCCHEHEAYMRAAGLTVTAVISPDVAEVKRAYGVPPEMYSCHTTHVGDYFVEGHVPLAAIERLLAESPNLDGIALPGMPAGSPGMGGTLAGPLTVHGVRGGEVVGVFGEF